MMKRRWVLLALLLVSISTGAQSAPPAAPCDSAPHHAFDFWVGEWDVANTAGAQVGHSRVERAFDGCVIIENWTSAKGGFAGMSLNTYDPLTKTWSQRWVDNGGQVATMTGTFEEKNLIYRRELKKKDGTPTLSRMTFFDSGKDKVRQLVEQSTDNGANWATVLDLRYSRHKTAGA